MFKPGGEVYFNLALQETDPRYTDVGSDEAIMLYSQYSTHWDGFAHKGTMFDADPASFVGKDMKLGAAPQGKVEAVAVTGKTACAGCAYGVRPITDADSLGIAVVAGDKVYVVEGGEKRYPDLFNARFDATAVELKGTVKQSDGKFIWVEPTSLKRSR